MAFAYEYALILTRRSRRNGLVMVIVEMYNQKGELILTNVTDDVVKCKMQVE